MQQQPDNPKTVLFFFFSSYYFFYLWTLIPTLLPPRLALRTLISLFAAKAAPVCLSSTITVSNGFFSNVWSGRARYDSLFSVLYSHTGQALVIPISFHGQWPLVQWSKITSILVSSFPFLAGAALSIRACTEYSIPAVYSMIIGSAQ